MLQQDRNFDHLIERFEYTVYNTAKGRWRLKLLKEDLADLATRQSPLNIWDAGCGFGQVSLWLAEQGHQLTLCDVSIGMLNRAQAHFDEAGLTARFHHEAAQTLASKLPLFDVVLCHAVLEWLAEPSASLRIIANRVQRSGYLSLLFYNRNAMIYKNVLKGGWRLQHILDESYLGKGKNLTPPNPQYPHEILSQLDKLGFEILIKTGIRVFHDYLSKEVLAESDMAELFELEARYCRLPTFWEMARYIHIVARRKH